MLGWTIREHVLKEEWGVDGNSFLFKVWLWLWRIFAPIAVGYIMLSTFIG